MGGGCSWNSVPDVPMSGFDWFKPTVGGALFNDDGPGNGVPRRVVEPVETSCCPLVNPVAWGKPNTKGHTA